MKKLIIILSLVLSTTLSALSQESTLFNLNPDNFDFPVIRYPESIMSSITGDFKKVSPGFLFPSNKMNELFNNDNNIIVKKFNQNRKPFYDYERMPCLKPEGNFSMLISVPDSTILFSIWIKKF